jgi:hypothetical protein
MSRRRRNEGASISLLPILSIQKCTMGIMVVIIISQNLISLGQTEAHMDDQYLEITGNSQDREPVYVECRKEGILLHPERTAVSLETLKGPGPSAYHQLLETLATDADKRYLVFLIRPDGVAAYESGVLMVYRKNGELEIQKKKEIRIGKDALLSGGSVVFTKGGKPVVAAKKGGQ